MNESDLRALLTELSPGTRADLRKLLIADHRNRDAVTQQLLRKRTPTATALADIVDRLTLDDDEQRKVVRLLGELEAAGA